MPLLVLIPNDQASEESANEDETNGENPLGTDTSTNENDSSEIDRNAEDLLSAGTIEPTAENVSDVESYAQRQLDAGLSTNENAISAENTSQLNDVQEYHSADCSNLIQCRTNQNSLNLSSIVDSNMASVSQTTNPSENQIEAQTAPTAERSQLVSADMLSSALKSALAIAQNPIKEEPIFETLSEHDKKAVENVFNGNINPVAERNFDELHEEFDAENALNDDGLENFYEFDDDVLNVNEDIEVILNENENPAAGVNFNEPGAVNVSNDGFENVNDSSDDVLIERNDNSLPMPMVMAAENPYKVKSNDILSGNVPFATNVSVCHTFRQIK